MALLINFLLRVLMVIVLVAFFAILLSYIGFLILLFVPFAVLFGTITVNGKKLK